MDIDKKVQKNPAGPALVIGIIAMFDAFIGGLLFGIIGAFVAVVLGIFAIIRGMQALKATEGMQGKGGIMAGAAAIVVAVFMTGFCLIMSASIKDLAVKNDSPVLEKYADSARYGFMGLSMRAKNDGISLEEIQAEIDRINSGTAAPAPADSGAESSN